MSQSRRARRMERRHKRNKPATLNLVSMIDMLTILVFFLMVNSSDVQVMANTIGVQLPNSAADQNPNRTVVIAVNHDTIFVQGKVISGATATAQNTGDTIPALSLELQKLRLEATTQNKDSPTDFAATIMGDKAIPYRLLKKILATCAANRYTHLSLAVNQTSGGL